LIAPGRRERGVAFNRERDLCAFSLSLELFVLVPRFSVAAAENEERMTSADEKRYHWSFQFKWGERRERTVREPREPLSLSLRSLNAF
jgi:hypothetical protein